MVKDNINSTINELLNVLDEQTFMKIINVLDIDKYVKKLTAYKFFELLVFAQVNDIDSLTHLAKQSKDEQELQDYLDLNGISTAQLSRKQCHLPPVMFEKIFRYLTRQIQSQLKQTPIVGDIGRLHVIDSSTMSMSLTQYPWATFRKTKAGVRLHLRVVVTKDVTIPDKAVLLPANHADRTQMNELVAIDPDALYLFDRGYIDYKQFETYCCEGVRFITRLKKNAKIEVITEHAPDPEHLIDQDAEVFLGDEQNGTKMRHPLRLIRTQDQEGNEITIVTSCFDLSAKEIGDLYRYRWKIETFFKWMKQHFKIKTFYGKSEHAVYNQIWIALITYCLQVFLQLKSGHQGPLIELKRSLRTYLFRDFKAFVQSLFRAPTRRSRGRVKQDWEREFAIIEAQFSEGEVSHFDDVTFDPLFI